MSSQNNHNFGSNKYVTPAQDPMKSKQMISSESQAQITKNASNIVLTQDGRTRQQKSTQNLNKQNKSIEKLIQDIEQENGNGGLRSNSKNNMEDPTKFKTKHPVTKINVPGIRSSVNGPYKPHDDDTKRINSIPDNDEQFNQSVDADFQDQIRNNSNLTQFKSDLDKESPPFRYINQTGGRQSGATNSILQRLNRIKISNIDENDGSSSTQKKSSSLFLDNNSESIIGGDGSTTGITQANFIKAQPLNPRDLNKLDRGQRVNAILRSIQASVVSKVLDISEFSTKFNVPRFIRVILYHILFWYFGAIVVVPLMCLFDSLGLSQNMGFWFGTKTKGTLVFQTLQHLVTLYMLILQVLKKLGVAWSSDSPLIDGIYLEQFLFFSLHLVIRSFIIAVRYGACSELRFNILKQGPQSPQFLGKDLLGSGWLFLDPVGGLLTEINSCMWRNQVEDQLFRFQFIEKLDTEYTKRLKDDNYYGQPIKDTDDPKAVVQKYNQKERKKEIQEFEERANLTQLLEDLGQKEPDEGSEELIYTMKIPKDSDAMQKYLVNNSYSGKLVLKEICLFAGAQALNPLICILIAFIRIPIPYVIRYIDYKNIFHAFNWDSWIYSAMELFFGSFLVFANSLFVLAGLLDFQRRKTMIQACGAMIDPQKSNYDARFRCFPTINLIDSQSLQSWFLLRLSIMDVGRKYINRIMIYSSTFLGAYLFYAIILLLQYFEFIDVKFPLLANVYAMYDIAFVMTCMIAMLWFGAGVNQQYIEDIKQLLRIKQTLVFIKANYQRTLDPAYDVADEEQPKKLEYDRIHGIYLKVFQRLYFAQQRQQGVTFEEQKEHIGEVIEELQAMLERLELDEQHQPLKLLGLKTSYDLMSQIYTTLAGMVLAVGQKVLTGAG